MFMRHMIERIFYSTGQKRKKKKYFIDSLKFQSEKLFILHQNSNKFK